MEMWQKNPQIKYSKMARLDPMMFIIHVHVHICCTCSGIVLYRFDNVYTVQALTRIQTSLVPYGPTYIPLTHEVNKLAHFNVW